MAQRVGQSYKLIQVPLLPSVTLNVMRVVQYGNLNNGVYLEGFLMITIDEAMKLFKVSRPTVYRWIKHYTVRSKVIDGVRYFDIDGLQNAFQTRRGK